MIGVNDEWRPLPLGEDVRLRDLNVDPLSFPFRELRNPEPKGLPTPSEISLRNEMDDEAAKNRRLRDEVQDSVFRPTCQRFPLDEENPIVGIRREVDFLRVLQEVGRPEQEAAFRALQGDHLVARKTGKGSVHLLSIGGGGILTEGDGDGERDDDGAEGEGVNFFHGHKTFHKNCFLGNTRPATDVTKKIKCYQARREPLAYSCWPPLTA